MGRSAVASPILSRPPDERWGERRSGEKRLRRKHLVRLARLKQDVKEEAGQERSGMK